MVIKLSDFERDICYICDYCDRIITSMKTAVEYGCDQQIIPYTWRRKQEKVGGLKLESGYIAIYS